MTIIKGDSVIRSFKVIAIAAAAGDLKLLNEIISGLLKDFPVSVIVVMHRSQEMIRPPFWDRDIDYTVRLIFYTCPTS